MSCVLRRVADDRGLRQGVGPDVRRREPPALRLHGGGEWRHGHAQITRHQGLGTQRRQVFPRQAAEDRISGLELKTGPAAAARLSSVPACPELTAPGGRGSPASPA